MTVPPETILVAGAALAMRKVFGPSLDTVGQALQRWTEYRLRNVGRILENAQLKLGDRAQEEGDVPPRVSMRILDEGSYSDDNLVIEYLGGVLASSRTRLGRDDRGNTFAALVTRLSTYELRSHYVWYRLMRELLTGREINFFDTTDARRAAIYIPFSTYDTAMEYGEGENIDTLFAHALHGLNREGLIAFLKAGRPDHIQDLVPGVQEGGMVIVPTPPGVELFLWAHGHGQLGADHFLKPETEFPCVTEVTIPAGTQVVEDVKASAAVHQQDPEASS